MFPESFVQKYLVWSKRDEHVFDPFSGRGTTLFESLLNGRDAAACDVNPVAVCISRAKSDPPTKDALLGRISQLADAFQSKTKERSLPAFFYHCFHKDSLQQLQYLRRALRWTRNKTDCFVAALVLGVLHGESHRSERYISNRMPRTISTKPAYSIKWWDKNGYVAPKRDVFQILMGEASYRFETPPPEKRGTVKYGDARKAWQLFPTLHGRVSLVITSPPYLDTTNFEEDQWLRLWFLGGPEYPRLRSGSDDRHTSLLRYTQFLSEAWAGLAPLLAREARLVIRIGGPKIDGDIASEVLNASLTIGLGRKLKLVEQHQSKIEGGQLQVFKGGKSQGVEFDFHFLAVA
jgi:hypothetical protein